MPKKVRWNAMLGALLRRAITHASEFERGACRSGKSRVGHVKFHSLQLLILFRAKVVCLPVHVGFHVISWAKTDLCASLSHHVCILAHGATPVLAQPVK